MNKKSLVFKSIALTSIFVLNVGLFINLNRSAVELDAYSTTSLPTTIDLNDNTDEQIRSYYSTLTSLDASERQGNNLLKNLKPILENGQKYYKYDNDSTLWKIYEITDRDWNKSPASAISGYNPSTKKITGYSYGSSYSSPGTNPYLHTLYVDRNTENLMRAWKKDNDSESRNNHGNNAEWYIDREHIWPKSAGFEEKTGAAGARGDPMHLWPGDSAVNSDQHSNYFYGNVKTVTSRGKWSYATENKMGSSSTFSGSSVNVFEPQDCDKGDIARACFYMAARYNYLSGSDSDGIDSNNPNLELVNNVTDFENSGYVSTTTNTGKLGIIQDLLEWNRLDPPDQFEIHRNNLCYNNFTGNRNPFIDFPSWADAIWGTSENGNYNPTPTKSASPTSDPINTFVANTFSISQSSLALEIGDTAEIFGSNATTNITWSIDDNTVASLDKNNTANNEAVTVTALKAGSATITATSGGNNVTCTVTVAEEQEEVDLELASSILAGDTVYLACSYSKGQFNGPSNNSETAIGTYTEYTTLPNSNTYALEVCDGSENDTYAFKIKAGTYANYYLAWSSGNSLKVSDALDSNSSWTVSFDNDKNVTITNVQDPARVIWWNVSYPRFSCYTGKTAGDSYKNVQLWKVVEEETPDQYFSSCTSIATLNGTESTSSQENTASVVFSEKGYTNGGVFTSVAIDSNVTLSAAKATSNYDPKYYNDGGLRVYGKNTMTITCDETITEIVISYSGGDYTGASITCSVGTLNEDKTVWTGEASAVTFTNTSNSQTRIPSVSVTYNREVLVVNDVFLRFGSTISRDDWNYIDETWGISDYGVMMAKETTLASYSVSSIKQAYLNKKYLSDFHRGSNVMPHPEVEEYKFTAKVTMTDEDNYDIVFCAAPYIVIDDEYYFLPEIRYSVNTLAEYCLEHGGSSLSEDALNLLKGN